MVQVLGAGHQHVAGKSEDQHDGHHAGNHDDVDEGFHCERGSPREVILKPGDKGQGTSFRFF